MKETSFLGPAAALLLTVSTAGCSWIRSFAVGDSMELVEKSAKLTLAWDPPLTDFLNRPTEVTSYRIYCREHGTQYWRFLGEIPATAHPEYTVQHSQLGNGLYDFAVRAVTSLGRMSEMHTSLDSSADPVSGWYVLWAQSD